MKEDNWPPVHKDSTLYDKKYEARVDKRIIKELLEELLEQIEYIRLTSKEPVGEIIKNIRRRILNP